MDEYKYYIYKICCDKNGRCYVGSSTEPKERILAHFSELKDGIKASKLWQDDFDKYGENCFSAKVIYSSTGSQCERFSVESYFIDKFKCVECGYNMKNDFKSKKCLDFENYEEEGFERFCKGEGICFSAGR